METHETVEEKVKKWDSYMQAAPSFEELRDVEFIRRSGKINMLMGDVMRELYDRGRYDGVAWLMRCKDNRAHWTEYWAPAMATFQKSHGPVDSWFTPELLEAWEMGEIRAEEDRLRLRLAELQARRKCKIDSE
jgi:hypothetical protein